jgi:predicted secreted Zn-dependent protease
LLPEVQKRWRGEYQVFYYGVRAHETVAACVATPVYEAFRERMTPTRAASP